MNRFGKILAVLLALCASAMLSAASSRTAFSRIKVELKMETPPLTSTSRTPSSNPRLTQGQKWLVLKVSYYPQHPRSDGPNQNTFIDDVRMHVTALFPAGVGARSGSYGIFSGEQTLWTVFCDGRQHVAMMFVPPHLLRRYVHMLEPYNGLRGFNKEEIKVEVVFTDRGGAELGRGYFGVSGALDKQEAFFQEAESKVPEDRVVNGAFFPRDKTPWLTMEPDQFDLVKPEGLRLPNAPDPQRDVVVVRRPARGPRGDVPPNKKAR